MLPEGGSVGGGGGGTGGGTGGWNRGGGAAGTLGGAGLWAWLRSLFQRGAAAGATSAAVLTQNSVVDKLQRYLLNLSHTEGGSKARWFRDALGFTLENLDDLAKQIVFDPNKAFVTKVTEHGTKYNQVITITGANGRVIDVTFGWIRNHDGVVRLTTAIPTKQ